MNKFAKNGLLSAAIVMALTPSVFAENLCVAQGYTLGFFNGVDNTFNEASISLVVLQRLVGDTYRDEPIQAEVFYNHTQGLKKDLEEVFEQRANELDPSGQLAKRKELLFDVNSGDMPLTNKLLETYPAAGGGIEQMKQGMTDRTVTALARQTSSPLTLADYQKHNARLDTLAIHKQKLMLVAHSQGNLFVNQAYDHIVPVITNKSVKVLHVAPASRTQRGNYLLADIDTIIHRLDDIPDDNLILPVRIFRDVSGHKFVETYLDLTRGGPSMIHGLIGRALSELETPQTDGQGGSFTVTLKWRTPGDIDLHAFEPSGDHVYYNTQVGTSGTLDVDDTVGTGPEHYFATCDSDALVEGTYSFGINNFDGSPGDIADLEIATSRGGVITTRTIIVGPVLGSSGDQSPAGVFNVEVTKGEPGKDLILKVQ